MADRRAGGTQHRQRPDRRRRHLDRRRHAHGARGQPDPDLQRFRRAVAHGGDGQKGRQVFRALLPDRQEDQGAEARHGGDPDRQPGLLGGQHHDRAHDREPRRLDQDQQLARAGGASGGFSAGVVSAATDGTQRAFNESLLKTVAQQVYSAGGDADTLMVGPAQKQVVSTFTGNVNRMQDTSKGTLATAIKVYESDFGDLKLVTNRFQRNRTAFVLQSDMWQLAWLDPIRIEDLAKTGDSMKKLLVGEYGLLARNEAASGVIADLS